MKTAQFPSINEFELKYYLEDDRELSIQNIDGTSELFNVEIGHMLYWATLKRRDVVSDWPSMPGCMVKSCLRIYEIVTSKILKHQ